MASALEACDGWDNAGCAGTPHCPPRCPRFVDRRGPPLLVRPVASAAVDAAALVDLFDCGGAGSLAYPPYSTTRGLREWVDGLLAEGWNFVATHGERVVGHAVLTPADAEEPEFGVFVDPDYRGRGLAIELLGHAVAHAAAAGHRGVVMAVERENRAMRSIATAHGFEVVGRPDEGDWVGFLTYRRRLSDLPPIEPVGPLTSLREG